MKKLRYVGKTIEDIIETFKNETGAIEGEYEINIIDKGSSGIFGLFSRDAVVEFEIKNFFYERKLKEYIENILNFFSENSIVSVDSRGKTFLVSCKSEAVGKLIGKHGKGLAALQHLATIYINRFTDTKVNVIVDAGNYREKRKEQIQVLVDSIVKRLIKTGGKVKLDPMFPFERKLVHEHIKNYPQIRSYSEGIDPYRYVVLELRREKYDNRQKRRGTATAN